MDRRTTLKWVVAAAMVGPLAKRGAAASAAHAAAQGYGPDPNLLADDRPGALWPLTFDAADRRLAAALADLILPADAQSPSASAVGVVDFIDEWVSAPYPDYRRDRAVLRNGFAWLEGESARRYGGGFADLGGTRQRAICDGICDAARAAAGLAEAARFFARFRDLTAGGYYSSAAGRKDLGYIGNVPLAHFDGPPADLLKRLNLD
jgi:Gluconate 2-dehydrogenase subunit 3